MLEQHITNLEQSRKLYELEEERRDVEGYEGLYRVSNLGGVKNWKGKHYRNGTQSYHTVSLSKDGKATSHKAHRLIAKAFIPNPDNKPQVNHKNGKPCDNRIDNLERCTNGENVFHAYRTLGKPKNRLGKHGKLHPESQPVLQYTKQGEFVKEWESANYAATQLGLSVTHICDCRKGKSRTHGGFIWKYPKDALPILTPLYQNE